MVTLDPKKELKYLYSPSPQQVETVDVPAFNFIMIDGALEAGQAPASSPAFQEAMQALYIVSYTLKFNSKQRRDNPIDYPVMALEGLWWVEGGEFDFNRTEDWRWTLMILQPDHITEEMFREAVAQAMRKRGEVAALEKLRLERFHEGLCLQIMHIGPYSEEPATIAKLRAFAAENHYAMSGKHHEVYLGDPRRVAPEKLKTILRHPVEKEAMA